MLFSEIMLFRLALAVLGLFALSACISSSGRVFQEKGWFDISPGETVRIFRASDQDLNCKFLFLPEGKVVDRPSHGTMVYRKTVVAPAYKPDNPRYKCNSRRGLGGAFFYTPNPGFSGQDFARIRQPFTDGSVVEMVVNISVKAP